MRKQFVKTLEKIVNNDNNVSLLLGDIGVFGFRKILKDYPERIFNIGIFEQATIGLSAGLSKIGMIPIMHTISPFMVERGLEQLKVDFGYQKLNGNFVSIGNSYDYAALGPTHHCPADVSLLSTIPNFQIVTPGNSKELDVLFNSEYNNGSPTYFRLGEYEHTQELDVKFGKANIVKKGNDATIICTGSMLDDVLYATENLDVTILYYSTIIPFDYKLLQDNFNSKVILCENFYEGTLNFIVNKALEGECYSLYNIGMKREFLKNYGKKEEHDVSLGLDKYSLRKKIEKICIK